MIVILMGPSGSGKTALGQALARETGLPFLEGDDFHSERNKGLMASGIALTDDDRWPWLDAMGRGLHENVAASGAVIAACSALRRVYRDRLRSASGERILFLHLDVKRKTLYRRIEARRDHYMPASLLGSQIAILEPPEADELGAVLSGDLELGSLVAEAMRVIDETTRSVLSDSNSKS